MRTDFKCMLSPSFALFVLACSSMASPDDRGSAPPGDDDSMAAPAPGDDGGGPRGEPLPTPGPGPLPQPEPLPGPEPQPGPEQPARRACEAAGQAFPDGASVPASDGCNQCTCYDGFVICSAAVCEPVACEPGVEASDGQCTRSSLDPCRSHDPDCVQGGDSSCEAAGQSFADGSDVPSGDACNTCRCDGGEVVCSDAACDPVFCALFVEASDGVCSRFSLDACISQDPDCGSAPEATQP